MYANPLHPSVSTHACEYSSLGGAVPIGGRPDATYSKRLPQTLYTPGSKWHSVTGRTNDVHAPIFFSLRGDSTNRGFSILDLGSRSIQELTSVLEGGEDRVLADTGRQRITFRIMWPGYSQIEWARSIDIATGGPITRAKLGQIVAQNFSRFIETHRKVACSTCEYQVGPTGIRTDHLYIVSLNNVFEDSWQADIILNVR